MDLSVENYQTRIVKPVWSASHKYSQPSQLNMWPIRQQNHSKRFYGNTKLKHNSNNQSTNFTNNQQEIIPMSIKLDVDFDRNKSYTSMAFCSTSKIKYMPLPGTGFDPFAGLKFGTPHPTIFPTLSRPVSRPVLLHGKRYTVIASEPIQLNTPLSHSDHDDSTIFRHDQLISDQRRRFNEIEQHKSNIRYRGITSEGYDFLSRRNYCLSGRRMKIRESKVTAGDRHARLQPTLNVNNHTESLDKYQETDHVEALSDRLHMSDLEDKQISLYDNTDSVITIDIIEKIDKPTQLNSQEIIRSIKKNISFCKTYLLNEDALGQSRELMYSFVTQILADYNQSNIDQNGISTSTDFNLFWILIQRNQEDTETSNSPESLISQEIEKYRYLYSNSNAFSIDVLSFLKVLSDKEQDIKRSYWSKIFQDLQIQNITESLLTSLLSVKISIHPADVESNGENENLAIVKLYFWIHLMKIFSMKPEIKLKEWIKIVVIVLVNKLAISEDLETRLFKNIEKFISIHFVDDRSSLNLTNYVLSIPWILKIHKEIFGLYYSIDEIAAIQCMIGNFSNQ